MTSVAQRFVDSADPGAQSPIRGVGGTKLVALQTALQFAARKSVDFSAALEDECQDAVSLAAGAIAIAQDHDDATSRLIPDVNLRAALVVYTMESPLYRILNHALRSEDRTLVAPFFPYLRLFHAAYAALPIVPSKIIYRGVPADVRALFSQGTRFTWWSITSGTGSIGVLRNRKFLGESGPRTLFHLNVSSARSIQGLSAIPSEDEWILPCGCDFTVEGVLPQGGDLCIIQVKEIGPSRLLRELSNSEDAARIVYPTATDDVEPQQPVPSSPSQEAPPPPPPLATTVTQVHSDASASAPPPPQSPSSVAAAQQPPKLIDLIGEANWNDEDLLSVYLNQIASNDADDGDPSTSRPPISVAAKLHGCKELSNQGLITFAECCPGLTLLDVSGTNGRLSDEALVQVANLCPNLTHVNVSKTGKKITDVAIIKIAAQCRALQYLDVSWTEGLVSDASIVQIAQHCPQLSHLDVSFTNGSITAAAMAMVSQRCPLMRFLSVRATYDEIDDESLRQVAMRCPQITHLDVTSVHTFTDGTLRSFAQRCTNLSALIVSRTNIHDASILEVVSRCPQLTELRVTATNVTDAAVLAVADRCPQLRILDVSETRGSITDVSIVEIATKCTHLTELDVSETKGEITDASILIVAATCRHLRKLNVSDVSHAITDKSISEIVRRCPELTSLWFWGSGPKITNASLVDLPTLCPMLEEINVNSSGVTMDRVVELVKTCRRLRSVIANRNSTTLALQKQFPHIAFSLI